jgi:hypothetical protein
VREVDVLGPICRRNVHREKFIFLENIGKSREYYTREFSEISLFVQGDCSTVMFMMIFNKIL